MFKKISLLCIILTTTTFFTGCTVYKPQDSDSITNLPSPDSNMLNQPGYEAIDQAQEIRTQIENTVYKPETALEITQIFSEALRVYAKTLSFDLSLIDLSLEEQKMLIQNAYYNALFENPDLKYAYNIEFFSQSTDLSLQYKISYMPYKVEQIDITNLPTDIYKIYTLQDLITTANSNIGKDKVPIAILNPSLEVGAMQYALRQAGYGYIIFTLNDEGTEIHAKPVEGRSMEECVSYIHKIKEKADEILNKIIKEDMTETEKFTAIYNYITNNIIYDDRYYSAPETLPYESRTAYGALYDQLAVCGGFAWAVNLLTNELGIPCYNVSGVALGGDHIWNIIKYQDDFYYFDPTLDKGLEGMYPYFSKTTDELKETHIWDDTYIQALVDTSYLDK